MLTKKIVKKKNETFADRLQELRMCNGISQKTLAEAIGISRQSINSYELEERLPSVEAVSKIADFFNVSCDYLIRGIEAENLNVQRELGINQSTINKIRYCHQKETLNLMLSSNYFYELCELFENLYPAYQELIEVLNSDETLNTPQNLYNPQKQKTQRDILKENLLKENKDIIRYRLENAIKKVVFELLPDNEI